MRSCEEIARLLSESMEHKLTLGQRIEVWIHLSMCRLCAGFARMIKGLRQAIRQGADGLALDASGQPAKLSGDARARIEETLRRRLEGG
jgi:transposase